MQLDSYECNGNEKGNRTDMSLFSCHEQPGRFWMHTGLQDGIWRMECQCILKCLPHNSVNLVDSPIYTLYMSLWSAATTSQTVNHPRWNVDRKFWPTWQQLLFSFKATSPSCTDASTAESLQPAFKSTAFRSKIFLTCINTSGWIQPLRAAVQSCVLLNVLPGAACCSACLP